MNMRLQRKPFFSVLPGLWDWEGQWEDAKRFGDHKVFPSRPADGAIVSPVLWNCLSELHGGFSGSGFHTYIQVTCWLNKSLNKRAVYRKTKHFPVFTDTKKEKAWALKGLWVFFNQLFKNSSSNSCFYFVKHLRSFIYLVVLLDIDRTFKELSDAEEQYSLCRELCKDLAEDMKKEGLKVQWEDRLMFKKWTNIVCLSKNEANSNVVPR